MSSAPIKRFTREGENWIIADFSRIGDRLILTSIGCDVGVNEIHDRVDFCRVDDQDDP